MFDQGEWLTNARAAMADYVDARTLIDEMEAEASRLLAVAIQAYEWPEDVPEPDRPDTYGVEHIEGVAYGEDLSSELAVALKTSQASAQYLIADIASLEHNLPNCWGKVTDGEAPLWQARRVAQESFGLTDAGFKFVDRRVAPSLGAVGPGRLTRALHAAVKAADPDCSRRHTDQSPRNVRIGGDKNDPLTGWLSARLDHSDAIYLDATVQLIADTLAAQGDSGTVDQRRAKGLGLLANPAAAVQLIGIPTNRGMDPNPSSCVPTPSSCRRQDLDADKASFISRCADLAPAFTPRAQVFVHMFAGSLGDKDAIARVEGVGPVLMDQIAKITGGCSVKITPAIHVGGADAGVDQYEIPDRIRHQVLLTNPHDVFPYSSIESRRLDLDHTVPYANGAANQTRPSNLGPLSRRAHRVKTHAGWNLDQPSPGVFIWRTGAGQQFQVDHTGTHRINRRE